MLLDSEFIGYQFIGWNRKGLKLNSLNYKASYLMKFKKPISILMPFYYALWAILLFIRLIFVSNKDRRIYAVGLESAFPAMLASFLKRGDYIFDNPDNFTSSYGLTGKGKKIIDKLESFVARRSSVHILPSEARVIIPTDKDRILYNTPSKTSLSLAYSIFSNESDELVKSLKKEGRFKLYINGRVVDDRGADYLPFVLDGLPDNEYCLVIAGEVASEQLEKFLSKTNLKVYRVDRVPNEISLAINLVVDVVFALYSPIRPINKLAESNKWYDCLAIGTHCITNKEILSVSKLSEYDNFSVVEYGNIAELINLIKRLKLNGKRSNQSSPFDWESNMLTILNDLNG